MHLWQMKVDLKCALLLLCLSFMACHSRPAEKDNSSRDSTSIGTSTKEIDEVSKPITDLESMRGFEAFFEKFNADPMFQKQHVLFPIVDETWEFEVDKPNIDSLYAEQWHYIDLSYDSTSKTHETDKYTQQLYGVIDRATLQRRGIANGIHIDYVFQLIDGEWFLIARKDYSD